MTFEPDPQTRPELPAPGSPVLRRFVWTMRIIAVFYFLATIVCLFFADAFLYLVSLLGRVLQMSQALPGSSDQFWRILAASRMATLCACSLLAAESPRTAGYSLLIILANLVSAIGFLGLMVDGKVEFALVLGVLVDFSIAIIVAWRLTRASLVKIS